MKKRERFTWLISPKSFVEMLGAEFELLKRSGSGVLLRFYISALALLAILMISIVSIFYAMEMLFNMLHIELLMAGFVSLLFVFIYVFMLNTFSKEYNNSTGQEPGHMKLRRRPGLSDVVRIVFIVLMAFFISKPVEVFLFQKQLVGKVNKHKQDILKKYEASVQAINKPDCDHLNESIAFHKGQQSSYPTQMLQSLIAKETQDLADLLEKQQNIIVSASRKINESSYFMFQSKLVSRMGLAWLICLSIVLLFLTPFVLIYTISPDDSYYRFKRMYESRIILEEYRAFHGKYSLLFHRKFHLDIDHYSDFDDPPFNKSRKAKNHYQPQDDFFKIYVESGTI